LVGFGSKWRGPTEARDYGYYFTISGFFSTFGASFLIAVLIFFSSFTTGFGGAGAGAGGVVNFSWIAARAAFSFSFY
jgi:hypothetical protein